MDFPKSVPSVGLVDGKFIDEDAVAGTPGSLIPSAWGNAVTQEILNVIQEAGLEPDEDDNTQLNAAIDQKIAGSSVSFASQAEAEAGESTTKAMSPLRVFQAIAKVVTQATETAFGWLKIATQAQVTTGTNDSVAVTPKKLAARLLDKADLNSPVFTGEPATNSTPPAGDNSSRLANTNFVYLAFNRLLVSATEVIKGLARFATQSEVNAGVDDSSIVTPKKLRAGFQIQLSVNGYIYFPSWMGGLVWQWGNRAFTSGSTSAFTTPFPNEALIVWALPNSIVGGSPSTVAANVQSLNQQSMILSWTAGGTYNFFWFALGR